MNTLSPKSGKDLILQGCKILFGLDFCLSCVDKIYGSHLLILLIFHGLHVMDRFLSDIKLYYFYVRLLYQIVLLYTVVINLLGLGLCIIHYDYQNCWIRLLYKIVLLNFMVHL